jgi:hypothetical protein
MRRLFRKPLFVFILLSVAIATPLLLLPINVFQGEIVYHSGISTLVEPRPLSLYFVSGLEYYGEELKGVQNYYLTARGWMLAFIFIIGIPALVAYRVYLKRQA